MNYGLEPSLKKKVRLVWWHMPIGYDEGVEVEDHEFKASLDDVS